MRIFEDKFFNQYSDLMLTIFDNVAKINEKQIGATSQN
jgi:hypothetical protein